MLRLARLPVFSVLLGTLGLLLGLALGSPRTALAGVGPVVPAVGASDAKAEEVDVEVAHDSPRASMARFVAAANGNRWAEAATYLELGRADAQRGPELARKLSDVLNHKLWLDPHLLSPHSAGKRDDQLPQGVDEIGRIVGADGKSEPVRLVRREARSPDEEPRWIFSLATVARIDGLYANLKGRWFREHLPEPLLRDGPGPFIYWQLIALPLAMLGCHLGGRPLAWLLVALMARLARRTQLTWDDEVALGMRGPARLLTAVPLFYFATSQLALYQRAEELVERLCRAAVLAALFWVALRALAAFGGSVLTSEWGVVRPSLRDFSWFSLRVARVTVWVVGGVVVLSQLGYPVGSLVTGLGIGGIAIALAAQKTVENLFGSVSILVDQPFRVGDAIRVDGVEGTVENIGLRSTRVRTLDRTLVVIANGKLADMRTECLTARDRMRFATKLRLSTATTTAQLAALVADLEAVLRAHEKVDPETIVVRFSAVGDGSLDVDAICAVTTTQWTEFTGFRHALLLGCVEATRRAGVELAARELGVPAAPAA